MIGKKEAINNLINLIGDYGPTDSLKMFYDALTEYGDSMSDFGAKDAAKEASEICWKLSEIIKE